MTQPIHARIDDELYTWAETLMMGYNIKSMNKFIAFLIQKEVDSISPDEKEFLRRWREKRMAMGPQAVEEEEEEEAPPVDRRKRKG